MFDLSSLPKITEGKKKRVGRGKRGVHGAKSGRGSKGALKRGKMRLYFEGGTLPLTKRLPMFRGKGKNKPLKPKPVILHIAQLNLLRAGSKVNIDTLIKKNLVDKGEAEKFGVKILNGGTLKKKLIIEKIAISKSAAEKIKKAGGKIIR